MLKKFAKFILGLAIFSLIGGCAVGSDYVKPTPQQVNLPAEWHAKLPHNGSDLQLIDWWGQFKDPTLSYLIESALQTNPSIFQAIAKIKQAQANLQGSRSFLFPSVTGIGSAEVDKNTIVSTNTTGGTGDVFSNNGMTNGYSAGVNMSWEIDLFGANRRAIEASEARYAASQQNWNDAKVSLAAQVADVYVSIRQCQNLLLTYQEENKSRLATQNITELRVNAGFSPRTDGNQASGSLYQNSSTLAQQRGVCEKYANQLVALSGVSHTQLEAKLSESFGYIPLPKEVSINALPAEIINQRPDVAAAERNLAAANADLSVAIANRYPQVSLTGSISANGGSLYAGQPTSWSLGPSISLPFTDGGYLRAQESLSSAKYEEALATYRSKIINAVQEVEDSLVRINAANQRVVAAEKAERNYAAYFEGYNQKYNTGWANLLDLETVRVTLIGSKEKLASAKLEQVEAWIALYKAVGGEWNKTVSQ